YTKGQCQPLSCWRACQHEVHFTLTREPGQLNRARIRTGKGAASLPRRATPVPSNLQGLFMDKQLGELMPVDLRTLWSNEAADFTPWLAKEANISRLGEAMGVELEVERTEVPVGPYYADILARDSSGNYVVI